MQIEFQTTEEDYKNFLNSYFFKRNLVKRLALLIFLSLWIGSFKESGQVFILTTFLLKAFAAAILLFIVFVLIPYVSAKISFNKVFKTNLLTRPKTMVIDDEGVSIKTDDSNTFWKWETLKNAEITNGYLFISLFTNQFYLIPLNSFNSENQSINFLGVIKNYIQKVRGGNNFRKIRNLYYWGLVGFIPNFGVIAGIILIVKGIQYNKIKLILIGVADILFTVFFWMVIFPSLNSNGFKSFSQIRLNSLIKNVEFYKLQNGQYPDSLKQLLKEDKFAPITDIIQVDKNRQDIYYNYERVGSKYFLFSSGQDGIPNTKDDLYPAVSLTDSSKIGFIKSK